MKLPAKLADRFFDERRLRALIHALGDDRARGLDGEVGDLALHFGDRLRFGAGDFLFGGFGAAVDLFVDLVARFSGEALGVAFG